jgi:hypothetical protein
MRLRCPTSELLKPAGDLDGAVDRLGELAQAAVAAGQTGHGTHPCDRLAGLDRLV